VSDFDFYFLRSKFARIKAEEFEWGFGRFGSIRIIGWHNFLQELGGEVYCFD
jgi:hypothetical protein